MAIDNQDVYIKTYDNMRQTCAFATALRYNLLFFEMASPRGFECIIGGFELYERQSESTKYHNISDSYVEIDNVDVVFGCHELSEKRPLYVPWS